MEMVAPAGPVYQAGTLSGNPLAMTAGIKTLELLQRPGVYDDLERITKPPDHRPSGSCPRSWPRSLRRQHQRHVRHVLPGWPCEPVRKTPSSLTWRSSVASTGPCWSGVFTWPPLSLRQVSPPWPTPREDVDKTIAAAKDVFGELVTRGNLYQVQLKICSFLQSKTPLLE